MPLQSEFGSEVTNNEIFVFPGCYSNRLTELGPPSNPACEPFTVRASGWLFDGAFECNCDSVAANNSNLCDPFGGQCDCADSVIGRTCSACGYNSFNVTSSGCQACDCVEAGTNPSCPCDSTTGECLCKDNFTGERCHLCKSGFKRELVNGNESIPCVPCECNGHSFVCHPITGVCMNCSNNTVGNFCEECEDGFFGDASSGGSCQACMCNHPLGSNSIVCDKVSGNCSCHVGFVGRICDACGDGFYDSSNGCRACNCSGAGTDPKGPCNSTTGECVCKENFSGEKCDRCAASFFNYSACDPCDCDAQFSVNSTCDESGACTCKTGVEGAKCDGGCRDGYFNLTSNGCSACTCLSIGTGGNLTCDKVTGQCDCIDGVTGVTCDRCQKGFYGFGRFSGIACRKCFCNEHADGCSLREIPTSAIKSTFDVDDEGWTIISNNGASQFSVSRDRQGFLRDSGYQFFAAPPKYLGNQLASYGQLFTFDLGLESICGDYPLSNASDSLRLKGGNVSEFLSYSFPSNSPIGNRPNIPLQTFTIKMVESNFFYKSDSDKGSHRPVTKEEFLNTLGDLKELLIWMYADLCFYVSLDNVTLNRANATENCTCDVGYEGLSCESCQEGFFADALHGGNCQPCDCASFGSNSTICDNVTGLCDCKRRFTGRRCDTDICESCFCYGHSDRCAYDEQRGCVCVDCEHNTTGDRCEKCLADFFRDPGKEPNDPTVCLRKCGV
ncbi:laminin subunit alpha-1-like [Oscarella lobularis]|uniref:laminin subunit alpha-1-like n=1 Tax=Oscarella lobularis TaxID=121494 RepID=UPI0033137727